MRKFTRLLKSVVFISIIFTIFLIISSSITADVGRGASHSGGSRSSSSSSRSSSFSFGKSTPSVNYSTGSNSSGINLGSIFFFSFFFNHPLFSIFILVFLAIFLKEFLKSFLNKNISLPNEIRTPEEYRDNNTIPESDSENSLMILKQNDPNFSKEAFESKVANMYIQLQEAWMNKSWRHARAFETDALFNLHNKQLEQLINSRTTNVVENICVMKVEFLKYQDDGINDAVEVFIKARINDYIIDDSTKKVISGDPKLDIYMTYIWTLIRKKGILTKNEGASVSATQCPNCGANVSINASGECEYCGSVVTSGQYDWVLSNIEVVDQQ